MTTGTGQWQECMEEAVALRRALHRQPEIAWAEEKTSEVIRNRLTALEIPWRPCATTGTVAQLAPEARGEHIALRADIDALAMQELNDFAWTSEIDGRMHACGHDGHTATLLATARWLKTHEHQLGGPVSLLFQPAEEGGHGAKAMIDDGALEGVSFIFGWHNWPAIPFGRALCPDGAVMAGNGTFELVIRGQGGHASQPELCRDPVLAASAIVQALQQVVSRRLPAQQATVVSVTSFDAPSGATIIPHEARLAGSFRIVKKEHQETVVALIRRIAQSTAEAYGTECEVTIHPRYRPTINHSAGASRYRSALLEEFGDQALDTTVAAPIMASEDFSYYLEEIPGAFALVGAQSDTRDAFPCHNPHYDFNDALIPHMARIYSRLVGAPPR